MLKKIILFFVVLIFSSGVNAQNIEDVFVDIDSNYEYYQELQFLYEKGVIFPDENKKFNPQALLNRDEFVGISMHTMCQECIMPYTDSDFFYKYSDQKPFFDVNQNNKYFYCISDASENNFVAGYNPGHVCQDGTTRSGEKPFCVENKITLDEAVAVLLRNSKIFTQEDNQTIISAIQSGNITQNLANDVTPFTENGEVYTFYGYLQKALSYQITDYDISGNEKKYFLIEKDEQGNINPKRNITREDFLKLAFIITKTNACSIQSGGNASQNIISTQLQVFPKTCTSNDQNCNPSNLDDQNGEYDFKNITPTTCQAGIKEVRWIFLNTTTGESFIKTGEYLENEKFPSEGLWEVRNITFDNCGGVGESKTTIPFFQNIQPPNNQIGNIGVQIGANPLVGIGPHKVDFEAIVSGCNNCTYKWNFGDGNTSNQKNPTHIFTRPGVYEVELEVTDEFGNTSTAKVIIRVEQKSEIATQIIVYDNECTPSSINCNNSDGSNSDGSNSDGKYDFKNEYFTTCQAGIEEIIWNFENTTTGETYQKIGNYLNNEQLPSFGIWKIESIVKDKCGATSSSFHTITYNDISQIDDENQNGSGVYLAIGADPISGNGPLDVNFESIVSGCNDCTYNWDFGDGNSSGSPNPTHTFLEPGVYEVTLTLTDSEGNTYQSQVVIVVRGESRENNSNDETQNIDTDGDGIPDRLDRCPVVAGISGNQGCPILSRECVVGAENTCGAGYECGNAGICQPQKQDSASCVIPTSGSSIFGNVQCLTCPCQFSVDFLAAVRRCDIIFPAIVSPDGSDIFSRGDVYLVPNK